MKKRGYFITFEGCEGVGKSTQLNMLKKYLESTSQEAIFTREPGGTEISEQIRKIIMSLENTKMTPVTEALLYAASRAQLVDEVIRPALMSGKTVICDRFLDSSIAYQGCARNLGVKLVKEINAPAIKECTPDVTIFIDLAPSNSFRTFKKQDRLEQEDDSFHSYVYKCYKSEAKKSRGRIVSIVPSLDKEETHRKIVEALRALKVLK